ncbi:hypothetical protein E2C01_102590 [Portunus trituberculatus]|uniref:Uncharacterized protein n=1 Tax=Portunus trituberculatus TaxID=210409 RepID=A0A5B7K8M0_PORTR|nr:hypothetical protein [Portunus trituberculatus]
MATQGQGAMQNLSCCCCCGGGGGGGSSRCLLGRCEAESLNGRSGGGGMR